MSTITTIPNWQIGETKAPLPVKINGLPFIGIAHKMGNNPLLYFVDLYKKYGAIFRTRMLNRKIVVMAGLEANRFLNTDGNQILDSQELFGSFGREFNTDVFLTAMDGEDHLYLRKQARQGYSRSAMMPHMQELLQLVDDYTRTLKPGNRIQILPVMQYLVTQQLGVVIAGRKPDEYFAHLQRLLYGGMI